MFSARPEIPAWHRKAIFQRCAAEPIAADARREGDGRENAKLKLIAGLLGVGYDTLKQRELAARRARARIWATAIAAVMVAFFGVIAYFLVGQARDANAAQFVAEARADLAQRDYARAEIAAAEALTYRDRPENQGIAVAGAARRHTLACPIHQHQHGRN